MRLMALAIAAILLAGCKEVIKVSILASNKNVAGLTPELSYIGSTGTAGNVGVAMSVSPTTLNDNGAVITNCVTSPVLSSGLTINTSTCVISGTPTETLSLASYSITATSAQGSSVAAVVSLSVGASAPLLDYTGATGISGNVGVAMSVSPLTLNDNGGAITDCVASPALSVGLSINTSTCVISGTPTGTLSPTNYAITATNSAGSSSAASVSLSVDASVPTLSYAGATGTNSSVSVAMSVSPTLNDNGAAITDCVASPALTVGLSINASTCVISGTPTGTLSPTSYAITATNSEGTSAAATVTLSVGTYAPTLSYAGATGTTGNRAVAMTVSPTTLNDNGDVITNCTSTPALPAGLSLNSTTCVISGTPSVTLAASTFTITVTNGVGSTNSNLDLEILDPPYDQVDDDNTATGFGGGTHFGTGYLNGVLSINSSSNYSTMDASWTPRWANMLGLWRLEEASWNSTPSEVQDSRSTNHARAFGNATTTTDSQIGSRAGIFDGTGDYILTPLNPPTGTNQRTIMGWVKVNTAKNAKIWSYGASTAGGAFDFSFETISSLNYILFRHGTGSYRFGPIQQSSYFHLTTVVPSGATTVSNVRVYVNGSRLTGVLDSGSNSALNTSSATSLHLGSNPTETATSTFDGKIDEVAVWDVALSEAEIQVIYERQSPKYSAMFRSRIINSYTAAANWSSLNWFTPLPFGKELPDGVNETSTDYSDLATDTLMNNLVALWHLNGTVDSSIADSASILESSPNNFHGTARDSNSTMKYSYGKLGGGIYFDGAQDRVVIPHNPALKITGHLTVSAWFNTFNREKSKQSIISAAEQGGYGIYLNPESNCSGNTTSLCVTVRLAGSYKVVTIPNSNIESNRWYHVVGTYDGAALRMYLNGKEVGTPWTGVSAIEYTAPDPLYSVCIGAEATPTFEIACNHGIQAVQQAFFQGLLDEIGIWNRALSATEVLQLYRRGINQTKFQVRSCTNGNCSDQDALSNFGWRGPGGNHLSYFSELYNNSAITADCVIVEACYQGEILRTGDVLNTAPSLLFNDFTPDGVSIPNAQYLQYRAILESDDRGLACAGGGEDCLPAIQSVEIGPSR